MLEEVSAEGEEHANVAYCTLLPAVLALPPSALLSRPAVSVAMQMRRTVVMRTHLRTRTQLSETTNASGRRRRRKAWQLMQVSFLASTVCQSRCVSHVGITFESRADCCACRQQFLQQQWRERGGGGGRGGGRHAKGRACICLRTTHGLLLCCSTWHSLPRFQLPAAPQFPAPFPLTPEQQGEGSYLGPSAGCTAVCAVVRDGELFVANAGDSRCVLCRGGNAVAMTQDHKPMDEEEYARITKVCVGGGVVWAGAELLVARQLHLQAASSQAACLRSPPPDAACWLAHPFHCS